MQKTLLAINNGNSLLTSVERPETEEEMAKLKGLVATARRLTDDSNKLFVMKSIMKAHMVKERVRRECEINKKISHTNIVKVLEIYESDTEVILVMDQYEKLSIRAYTTF